MNNDDIKKYIDLSKLYTEVDLEKNQKVEEGIVDWFVEKLGLTDAENDKAVGDLIDNLDPNTKKEVDDAADKTLGKETGTDQAATTDKVEPRPTESGQIGDYGRNDWDQKYGATHNADGTPKDAKGGGADNADGTPKDAKGGGADPLGLMKPNTTIAQSSPAEYKSIVDAQDDKTIKKGDVVVIGGEKVTADETEQGKVFFIDANGEPLQQGTNADDGSVDAVGSEEDPEKTDAPTDKEGGVAKDAPVNTKDLMTRYNEGGKKPMPEIKKLQTELGRLDFNPKGIDGKYGNGTYKAVQDFQKSVGLPVDGQAGPDTLAALEKAIKDQAEKDNPKGKEAGSSDANASNTDDAYANDAQAAQNKADTDADSMTAKNQDNDIKTAQPNADLDRYIELLNKLEGGEKQSGAPNAELDAQQRGNAVAENDLRSLIAIVEAKLLAEQLTDAEAAELEALHTKVQGYVDIPGMDVQKIQDALKRYSKLKAGPDGQYDGDDLGNAATTVDKKGPDGQYDGDDLGNAPTTPTVTLDTISAQIKKGITFDQLQKAATDAEALEPEDAAKDANILKKLGAKAKQLVSTKEYRVRYVFAKGAETLGIDGLYRPDGKSFIFMKDGQPSAARGGSLNSAMQVAQLGLLPPKKVEDFKKLAPNKPKFQAILDAHAKATGEGGAEAVASANVAPSKEVNLTATGTDNFNINRSQPFVDIMDGGKKTRVYGDPALLQKRYPDQKVNQPTKESTTKENKMKKAIKEASMNISINGDSAAEVAELAGILKNAGMDTHSHSNDMAPKASEMPPMPMDPHDDMVSKMSMMDEPAPDDSGCGMEEETVEEDGWDNSPEEAYADHQTMTQDLSGGINRRKPQGAIRVKDPAVALETSIRERLWAALNEKVTEGKKKKKSDRGAMEDVNVKERGDADKKKKKNRGTMEGSKGKTSRGTKKTSRG